MILWLFAWSAAGAPPAPKLEIPGVKYTYDAAEVCLGSGLLLQVVNRPGADVVALSTVIAGGEAAEGPDQRGAAHLVEHLWSRRMADRAAGLDLSASTSRDGTVYVTIGDPADLEALLALEAERLVDPVGAVDEATFAAVREGVITELLATGEHADAAAYRRLDAMLWPADHPYAKADPTVEDVRGRTLEQVEAFAKAHYRPDNASIRIEGAVDFAALGGMLDRALPESVQGGPHGACMRRSAAEPPPDPAAAPLAGLPAPVSRPRLYLAWSLPAAWRDDDTRTRLAVTQLQGFVASAARTSKGVRESWDTSVSCSYVPGHHASAALCRVEIPDRADPTDTLALVASSLSERWGPAAKVAAQTVHQMLQPTTLTTTYAEHDRLTGRAMAERGWSTFYGVADPAVLVAETLMGTQPHEVADVGRKWLGSERMVAVALIPTEANPAGGAVLDGFARVDAPALPAWRAPTPGWSSIEARELENGLDVWTISRPDTAWVARSALVLRGGWATSPHAGETEFLDAVQTYAPSVSSGMLSTRAAVTTWWSWGSQAVQRQTLGPAGNLDAQLWAQRAWMETPRIVDRRRHASLDAKVEPWQETFRERPWQLADALRDEHLLPGDRASVPWWERNRDARYVHEADAVRWREALFRPDAAVLVVAGPATPEEAAGLAEAQLGGWKVRGDRSEPTMAALPAAPERRVFLLEDPLSAMATVTVACRLPGRTDENHAALAVLEAALDRGLYQSLEQPGGAWDADASLTAVDPRVTLLTLEAEVRPADADAALAATLAVVERLSTRAPDDLVAWARLSAAGRHGRAFATADAAASELRTAASEGRSIDALRRWPEQAAAVDASALAGLLADCAGHEAATVVSPQLGSGPSGIAVETVDWLSLSGSIAASLR